MPIRVLQLSDLHLCGDPDTHLYGVPTQETFRAVLEHIRSQNVDFDHLIITGDLADDGEIEAYRILRGLLNEHLTRCRLLPGNQDDREHIRRVFPEVVGHNEGPLTFAFRAGNWKLIGLDTLVSGAEEGYLPPDQLDWLITELAAFVDMPTVIFLHHPPVPVYPGGKADLDHPERFLEIVAGSPQVRVVCAGHVHYEFREQVIPPSSRHLPQPFSIDPRKMTHLIYSHLDIACSALRQIPTKLRSCVCQRLPMHPWAIPTLRLKGPDAQKDSLLEGASDNTAAITDVFEIPLTQRARPALALNTVIGKCT